MADIVGRFKKGKIQVNVVKGEYKGKPTVSYTLKKRVYNDGQWQDSDFLSITDMQDILSLATKICANYVKFEKIEPKPKEPETDEGTQEEMETPF